MLQVDKALNKGLTSFATILSWATSFPGGSDGKDSACNAGDQVRSLGQEDPLEKETATHSSTYMENPMDRRALQATVHSVTKELDTT